MSAYHTGILLLTFREATLGSHSTCATDATDKTLRACFKNGARLCRRPAAACDTGPMHRKLPACCGWSRTTQPPLRIFKTRSKEVLRLLAFMPSLESQL